MAINTILITSSNLVKLVWSRTFNGLDLYSYSPCTLDRLSDIRHGICNPAQLELPLFLMPNENDWTKIQDFFADWILPWGINVDFIPSGKTGIAISEYLEFCGSDPIEIDDAFCNLKDPELKKAALENDDWRKFTVSDFMFNYRLIVTD